jgi:hypothetical protein
MVGRTDMDLAKVLAELREELADLNAAIDSLEQLPPARPKRGDAGQRPAQAAGGARRVPQSAEGNSRNRGSA